MEVERHQKLDAWHKSGQFLVIRNCLRNLGDWRLEIRHNVDGVATAVGDIGCNKLHHRILPQMHVHVRLRHVSVSYQSFDTSLSQMYAIGTKFRDLVYVQLKSRLILTVGGSSSCVIDFSFMF